MMVLVRDILRAPGFFRNLTVMPHAQEVVKKLTEQYDVYIATAAMDVLLHFMINMSGYLNSFHF